MDKKKTKSFEIAIDAPAPGYTTYFSTNRAKQNKAMDYLDQGENYLDWGDPIAKGQKPNLDDSEAQSLKDAIRLRMQLPR